MRHLVVVLVVAALAGGCASGGAIRELGSKEKEVIDAVRQRISENEPKVEAASKTLGELGASYVDKEFGLELALAKAKRLDSMRAPWAAPPDEFRETQRAVVLYHLYDVEMAEQRVLDARMAERRAAVQEINRAYGDLEKLLVEASKSLELVLGYLNQPKSARILAFTESFLGEVTAFRERLAESDSPRLQKLAADVARYEMMVGQAKQRADSALQALMRLGGEQQ